MDKRDLKFSYHPKLLTGAIAALCTGLVASSISQASDIDIYQKAKAGDITLMFVLDISGSMGYPQLQNNASACDIPNDVVQTGYSNTWSNNGVAEYKRYYCTAAAPIYYYMKSGSYWYSCGNSSLKSDCITKLRSQPSTSGLASIYSNYNTYYYKTGPDAQYPDRITRVKDGMIDLLNGNTSKGILPISDDKLIGLTTFSRPTQFNTAGEPTAADNLTGQVRIPARRLDAVVNGKTQRRILIEEIAKLGARGGTPTANAYAEAAASLMGTTTQGLSNSGFNYAGTGATSGGSYVRPDSITKQMTGSTTQCSGQGVYVLTDGDPNGNSSASGLMKKALSGKTFACTDSDTGWNCIQQFSQFLLNNGSNPVGLKIKTAVVGFGSDFNIIPSFNRSLSLEENLANINNSTASANQKEAAKWGVNASGGWYSGSSSQDVVSSVNAFLGDLGSEIPAVTTGSPTIPKDSLNPAVLQKQAYFPQFQPTPDKNYQLWAGNLKKYAVVNGILKDRDNSTLISTATATKGQILPNRDFWAYTDNDSTNDNSDSNTPGSNSYTLKGGAWSQLLLTMNQTTQENRNFLTNRSADGSTTTTLRQIKKSDLTDTTYQTDGKRGYLMALLGYPMTVTQAKDPDHLVLNATPSSALRQIGALMHSSPLLITNSGQITYTNGVIDTQNREDYVLFGTTQGLLHIVKAGKNDSTSVDSNGGKEVFTFVPNEMIEKQPEAFLKNDAMNGGVDQLYYGIDGPWASYTQYVLDGSRKGLTVGKGYGSQEGKQIVYGGLRMGGRSYYALNLQDMSNPKLLFQISPDEQKIYYNGSSSTYAALDNMGQSWSKPSIGWVNWKKSDGKTTERKRVMFVGGGYDEGYENDTYNPSISQGAGVYMFDADNGKLLWWASAKATTAQGAEAYTQSDNLKYSVVSEIRTEDRNGDGLIDHLYFGDLGGQLFRIDLDNTATTNANFAKLPQLLLNLNNGAASPRFYEMPAFSVYDYNGTTFAVVSIGSGNRSKPLAQYAAGQGYKYDAVYNIYDKDVADRNLYKADFVYQTPITNTNQLGEITNSNWNTYDDGAVALLSATRGWFYQFKSTNIQDAKVFSTPIVLNHRMFVSTFDGGKAGMSGDCGAGVKGESFLNQFCMPFGQCSKSTLAAENSSVQCAPGTNCSQGAGIQDTAVVDDGGNNNDGGGGGGGGGSNGSTNNKNYCVNMGNRGVTTIGGIIASSSSKMCLIPQRWYVR